MMETWLPRNIRLLRMRQGLTLVDAAKKTGVTRATLSELERGHQEPIAPTLMKIAEGYGVPIEELLEEPSAPLVKAPPAPEEPYVDLGRRIRVRRRALNLTQEDLAGRAGVRLNTIGDLERGVSNDPHYSTLTGIAKALDMSVAELMGESATPLVEAPPSLDASEAGLNASTALIALLADDKDLAQWCISGMEDKEVAALTMAAFRLGDMAREKRRIRERKEKR